MYDTFIAFAVVCSMQDASCAIMQNDRAFTEIEDCQAFTNFAVGKMKEELPFDVLADTRVFMWCEPTDGE